MFRRAISIAILFCLSALPALAQDPQRLALVIGNDAYRHVTPLERATADASAFARTLRDDRGFEVFEALNADRATMVETITRFLSSIRKDDIALVFYAGHGVQLDPERRDTLYLLPTDIPALDGADGGLEFYLSSTAINFATISQQIADRGAQLRVFILDSCRNNPFATSGTRAVGVTRGLGLVTQSRGEFVVFSAAPGNVALDRLPDDTSPNSVFTRVFLKHFQARAYLEDVINEVQEEVLTLSRQAAIEQEPYYTDGVAGKTCLDADCSTGPDVPPENPFLAADEVEEVFWQQCETRDNPAYCEAYLSQYPTGIFATLAELRLEELTAPPATGPQAALLQPDLQAEPQPPEEPTGRTAEDYAALLDTQRPPEGQAPPALSLGKDCEFCPHMIDLPGGPFRMGSISGAGGPEEQPVTDITLPPFQLSQSEITIGEFRRFIEETGYAIASGCFVWTPEGRMRFRKNASWENPGYAATDDMPVSCINWDDAARYTFWLNNLEGGGGYRLPSEAEFEYAARAGTETDYPWGDDPAEACTHVNAADAASRFRWKNTACTDAGPDVVPVAPAPTNGFGLSHMIGNLWEWTADCWSGSHEGASPQGAPRTDGLCEGRVLKGGSWDDPTDHLRPSYRVSIPAQRRQANIGFRVAR